jgi:hypothetical protein
VAPEGRQQSIQCLESAIGKPRNFAAVDDKRIGRKGGWAARIRDDGEPVTARAGLFAEHLRHVEKISNGVDPQHADPAKSRFQHFVASGE